MSSIEYYYLTLIILQPIISIYLFFVNIPLAIISSIITLWGLIVFVYEFMEDKN